MGESSGSPGEAPGGPRSFWLIVWSNRTKIVGYAGVIAGSVQMAIAAGSHWQVTLLGALVAAIGHYNSQHPGDT